MKIEPPQEYWELEEPKKITWFVFLLYQTIEILIWGFKIGFAFLLISAVFHSFLLSALPDFKNNICPLLLN